jgi:hypothetical protein
MDSFEGLAVSPPTATLGNRYPEYVKITDAEKLTTALTITNGILTFLLALP